MVRLLVRAILRLCFRVRVRGEMHAHERHLIIANHQSFLDGVLLGAFLPVTPVWVVHTSVVARWYFRWPLKFLPHMAVDTKRPMAIKTLVAAVEAGRPVLVFPEGRITVTGSLMKIYDGPAFVAVKAGATVTPVHIQGAVYSWFSRMQVRGFPRKLFPRITVTIHPSRTIHMPEGRRARDRRRRAAEIMRRIMWDAAAASREDTTVFGALLDTIRVCGTRRVVLEDIRLKRESYGSLLRNSLALGRLVSKFTAEGECVGVLMPNASPTVALLFGLVAMGRVPALLNYTSGAEGMERACRAAAVRTVLTSRAFLEKARLKAPGGVEIVYLEDLRPSFGIRDKLWLIGWARWFPRAATYLGRPEDPAIVLFTSGSEGRPKGVVLSHRAILTNVAQLSAGMDFSATDRFLSALPQFHAFGLTIGANAPLLTGCYVFLSPSPLHYRMIPEMVYDYDCTVFFATNTFLANYARMAHPYDFRRVRILAAGAEKVSEEVRRTYAEQFGVRIIEGYGATECGPMIAFNSPMRLQPGTVGEMAPLMEYRLEPVAGIEAGGILHVRGPNLMAGYLREERPGVPEPPSSIFGPGWYSTGDIASVEDGIVTLLGRVRRFAKVAGEMVALDISERIAGAASPDAQHAAIAVRQEARGEAILLYTEDPTLTRDRLQRAARENRLPEIAVPRRLVHVPRLPLLGNGKKDYVTLERMTAAQEVTIDRR